MEERKIEFDFPGRLTAPQVDSFLKACVTPGFTLHGKKGASLVFKLGNVIKKIKAATNWGNREFWIEAPRGSFEEFLDFKKANGCEGHDDLLKIWKEQYSKASKWYRFSMLRKEGYGGISVGYNSFLMLKTSKLDESLAEGDDFLIPFLEWLLAAVKKCHKMAKEGLYNEYVETNLPYEYRFGLVSYADYWKAYPESKKPFLDDVGQNDIREFLDLVEKDITNTRPENMVGDMTAGLYMACASAGYRILYGDDESKTDKEVFKAHADWGNGFFDLDENDPIAFSEWIKQEESKKYRFKLLKGHRDSSIILDPRKCKKGTYFALDIGFSGLYSEAVKLYLGIYRKGFPILFIDAYWIARKFLGKDYIGIIPAYYGDSYYDEILDERPYEFRCLNKEDEEKLFPYIRWAALEQIELV